MNIIDAHLHFKRESYFDRIALAAGHENTESHLKGEYERLSIKGGVVMGNEPLENTSVKYPDCLCYCVGIGGAQGTVHIEANKLSLIEEHLRRADCVGVKLYPGYQYFYVYEDFLSPLYELAAKYDKPVAVHTGLTAGSNAYLKYSHPLVIDEAAAKFPKVNFVMCHFGEPWFTDAVAVMEKNANVTAGSAPHRRSGKRSCSRRTRMYRRIFPACWRGKSPTWTSFAAGINFTLKN